MVSVTTTFVALSWPVLELAMVYSRRSPGSTLPPFKSVTVFCMFAAMLGVKMSMAVVTTAG